MVGVFGNSQKVSGDLWGIGLGGGQQLGEGRTGGKSPPSQTPAGWWGCAGASALCSGVFWRSLVPLHFAAQAKLMVGWAEQAGTAPGRRRPRPEPLSAELEVTGCPGSWGGVGSSASCSPSPVEAQCSPRRSALWPPQPCLRTALLAEGLVSAWPPAPHSPTVPLAELPGGVGPVPEEPLAAGLPRGAGRVPRGLDGVAESRLSGGRWRGGSEAG